MAGRIDFRKVETPTEFQQLCERLLARIFPDFHPVNQAGGDGGVDGFATWGDQFFQFAHTQRNVPLQKVRSDLEKVGQFRGVKKWYFICSQSLSIATWRFVEAQRAACPFEIVVWDGAVLKERLSHQPDLVDEFFPEFAKKAYEGTQAIHHEIRGLRKTITRVRKRSPRAGDAQDGLEVNEDQRQDIHDLVVPMAKEEARRQHREKEIGIFISKEWAEFNKHFCLSAYDRLPRSKFGEAIAYLREKFNTRRNNEPNYMAIERERKGIYAMSKSFRWSEEKRREFYLEQVGKDRLSEMSRKEIHKVFKAMRALQDATS